jgi:hypothetical protein
MGLTWQPLSVRDGRAEDEGPFEGVPNHLVEPLCQWVNRYFGGSPGSDADTEHGPQLVAAIRYPVAVEYGRRLTVRDVTWIVRRDARHLLLDVVDAVLHLREYESFFPEDRAQLREILRLGGSVWQVGGANYDRLVRRVDPTATAAFVEASSSDDVASAELKEAWTAAYARDPDASDAWDHAIKAVEASLIPIVTPTNAKATLGSVIRTLNEQPDLFWLELEGPDKSASTAPLIWMLRLMWPNPDRHGGADSRKPSLMEAQAVVHLAVTIVQWAASGVLGRMQLGALRSLVLLHHRSRDASTLADLHAPFLGPCAHRRVVVIPPSVRSALSSTSVSPGAAAARPSHFKAQSGRALARRRPPSTELPDSRSDSGSVHENLLPFAKVRASRDSSGPKGQVGTTSQ